jgi:hypothetical protein
MSYNIYEPIEIAKCISVYITANELERVEVVSLTLSYGMNIGIKFETPSLLVGLVTDKDIKNWDHKLLNEYIWNQAEYQHSEINSECIDKYFDFIDDLPREYHIKLLIDTKNKILNFLKDELNYCPYIFVHDLDDFDYEHIIQMNFSQLEQDELKLKNYIKS